MGGGEGFCDSHRHLLLSLLQGLLIRDSFQRHHTVGEGRHGGHVVGENRGHDSESHRERPGDTQSIGGQDQIPTFLHVLVQGAGDVSKFTETMQAFLHEHDLCGIGRNRRRPTQ